MSIHSYGLSARSAALLGAASLALGTALTAVPAYAAPADGHSDSTGKATATAARVDLNVSVLNAADVPVKASLNAVSAPKDARETLLTAEVNGAHEGKPVKLVQAEVANSSAKANAQRTAGDVKLVKARVFAPGLVTTPLVSADLLKASAKCVAGKKPVAKADLANVSILGEPVDAGKPGSQQVEVPGVGTVDIVVEEETTTDSTGAATALSLKYTVNPGKLNVVKATGEIVLAEATCAMPMSSSGGATDGGATEGGATEGGGTEGQTSGGSSGSNEGSGSEGTGTEPQTGGGDLAETGGNSATPIIAGVGAVLVVGGGAMYLMRRRGTQSS